MELIKIIDNNGNKAVSARELHKFLEVGTRFNDWIPRMFEYGFTRNQDYSFLSTENQSFSYDYVLTLDCAKEISMIQRSEKGKIARQYFIECEKKLKNPAITLSRTDLAKMVIEAEVENQNLQLQIQKNASKVVFTDAVLGSKTSCLIGELAKILNQNGVKIGQNRLFDWLRDNGYLGRFGERKNVPNQRYIEQGLFELKKGVRSGNDGVIHNTITPKVTGKGQVYFINKFLNKNNLIENQ